MNFSKKKLPVEATSRLRMCPVETVKPFALMIAPVYVFMRRNEKFISIKAPLDFFTTEELERLRSLEMLFMPEFVESVLPYRELARRLRTLLDWKNRSQDSAEGGPAPYEVSDAVLRLLAPVWGKDRQIESFFVVVFINELCSLLPSQEMIQARERDLQRFERAIVISAWMVFIGLNLGLCDLPFLDSLRLRSFRGVLGTHGGDAVPSLGEISDIGDLYRLLDGTLQGEKAFRSLGLEFFKECPQRVAQKIVSRVQRIADEGLSGNYPLEGSIYGGKGFVDV